MTGAAPTEFVDVQRRNQYALVRRDGAETIAAALFDGTGCHPVAAAGRGAMMRFHWQGKQDGILRVCRRGGLLGHVLKEGFLLHNRPLAEFRIHEQVRARGIPAPPLLGVRWLRRGPFYYGALATELMPGCDLDAWLRMNSGAVDRIKAVLRDCGALIRRMHDKGVVHADLQVKNIFASDTGLLLLDFDRARVGSAASPLARACNLLRLRRSFEKRGFPEEYWRHLMTGYDGAPPPRWLDRAFRVKARFSDMMHGRRTTQV